MASDKTTLTCRKLKLAFGLAVCFIVPARYSRAGGFYGEDGIAMKGSIPKTNRSLRIVPSRLSRGGEFDVAASIRIRKTNGDVVRPFSPKEMMSLQSWLETPKGLDLREAKPLLDHILDFDPKSAELQELLGILLSNRPRNFDRQLRTALNQHAPDRAQAEERITETLAESHERIVAMAQDILEGLRGRKAPEVLAETASDGALRQIPPTAVKGITFNVSRSVLKRRHSDSMQQATAIAFVNLERPSGRGTDFDRIQRAAGSDFQDLYETSLPQKDGKTEMFAANSAVAQGTQKRNIMKVLAIGHKDGEKLWPVVAEAIHQADWQGRLEHVILLVSPIGSMAHNPRRYVAEFAAGITKWGRDFMPRYIKTITLVPSSDTVGKLLRAVIPD